MCLPTIGSFNFAVSSKFRYEPQNLLGPTILFLLPPAPEIIFKQTICKCLNDSDQPLYCFKKTMHAFNIDVVFCTGCSNSSDSGSLSGSVESECTKIIITRGVFCAAKSSFLTNTRVVAVMITKLLMCSFIKAREQFYSVFCRIRLPKFKDLI